MRSHLPLIIGFLLLGSAASTLAQIPVAKVVGVTGVVQYKQRAGAEFEPIGSAPMWLWAGTVVRCEAGATLTLVYDGKPPSEKHTETGPKEFTVAEPKGASQLVAWKSTTELFGSAAKPRANATLLLAPASAKFIPGRPIKLRWSVPADVAEVSIVVQAVGGEPFFRKSYAAKAGTATPQELTSLLAAELGKGHDRFRIACLRPGAPAGTGTTLEPIAADERAKLEEELAACGDDTHVWRPAFRAAVFAKFRIYDAAIDEIEAALATPELAGDPSLRRLASSLFELAGHRQRAAALNPPVR